MRHGDLRGRPSRRSSDGSSHYLGIAASRPQSLSRCRCRCLGRFELPLLDG